MAPTWAVPGLFFFDKMLVRPFADGKDPMSYLVRVRPCACKNTTTNLTKSGSDCMLLKKSHILPSAGPTYRACKITIAVLVKRKVCASEKQPHVLPSADSKTLTLHVTRSTQLLFVFKNKIILDN